MKVSIIRSKTVLFSDLCNEWESLLAESTADCIFLTPTWLSVWWHVYHPGEIWTLTIRDEQTGRLDGLAPWFMHRDTRTIEAIGCIDVTDYLDIIMRRGYEAEVLEAVAAVLDEQRNRFDRICICNIRSDSPTLTELPRLLAADRGFSVSIEQEDVAPGLTLPADWETYVAGLDKKNRHELRRKLRRASGEGEGVSLYIVGPDDDLQDAIEHFLALMAASGPDKAAFLQDAQHVRFFRRIIPAVAERGWLQLSFLTVHGEPAASYLSFDYGNEISVYNSGHNPGAHRQLSPGIVLMGRLIEYAIALGRTRFDFLRGNESYKYDLGGKDTVIYTMTVEEG